LMENDDSNSQNFFIYSPSTNNGWYFLPWDADGAWDFYGQPIEAAGGDRPRWTQGVSNWWNVMLHKRFLKDSDNLQDLIDMVGEMRDILTEAQTNEYLDAYKALIFDLVTSEPDLSTLDTVASEEADVIDEVDGEIDRLAGVIEEAYQTFLLSVQRPMPVWLGTPTSSGGETSFNWDESYDFQGDNITYDFQVSTDSAFADEDIVSESLNRTSNTITIDSPAAGTYYYRVTIRDDDDPDNNWQYPFDETTIGGTDYDGVKQFTIE